MCELCNNELRSISNFRRELIFKQTSLYEFVEGNCSIGLIEQVETIEDIVPSIKSEIIDPVVIKSEHVEPADFSMYSSEYVYEAEDESHMFQAEDLCDEQPVVKEPKKHYKRALCGLCGNSYYKDQLQRHIDVSPT